jgi:bifunctional UDP-N-acetylglucosamine pyrophosphorylase/glucosamine-1-phosphate N-acetyltransferase
MRSKTPKVLHELCGRPMLLWPLLAALEAGAGRVVVVDSPQRALEGVLPEGVELAVQERPDGTGGAVMAALAELDRAANGTDPAAPVLILSGDVPLVSAAAISGRQALPRLSAENAQRELYLPQVLDVLRSDDADVTVHLVEDERLVLGINDRASLARVREIAQASIHERHMLAGVTIVDPAATVIDVEVEIGRDTVIEPFTTLRGSTRIGEECVVRHSYLVDCLIEDGVSVGPFAYLRPGTVLRGGSKVGTFVEVKNSEVGAGAKIPHLSYIGDADVGEKSNLGAATITANYDGRAKHRTTVGARVHTGVDTTLVAPVTVGDDAYTGAGSVITEDVPPGALGIARERQANIEGYARRDR